MQLPLAPREPPCPWPQPRVIWSANLALLAACYGIGYTLGEGETKTGRFSGALNALDFGSGQERGMVASQREKLAAKKAEAARKAAEEEAKEKERVES